jgi:hypothetical protein
MKNLLSRAGEEIAAELVITAAIVAVSLIFHEINLAIRAIVGPDRAPIVWGVLMLLTLVGVATYLIRRGNNGAVTEEKNKNSGQMTY